MSERPWGRRTAAVLALAITSCGDRPAAPAKPVIPRFTVRGRWSDPTALRYAVDPAGGAVSPELFQRTLERALGVWAAAGHVGFVPCGDHPPDVVFSWGGAASAADPEAPFGRDTSVAITGPVGPGCMVRFDASRAWQEWGGHGPSLYQAAVHEIGHVLGLGHSRDPASVLFPQREAGSSVLAASDLDGLHSLYGGGDDAPGDLVIERAGVPVLRRVAPPQSTSWTVFDCDGDGDDEILVWARGSEGDGALTIYHFTAGPRLERTVGPILGFAGHGAEVAFHAPAEGARFAEIHWPDGSGTQRQFDAGGFPSDIRPATHPPAPNAEELLRRTGDFDGDGAREAVLCRHR